MGTRVAIHGASGRLGQLIATEADSDFAGPVPREGAVPAAEVIIDVSSAAGLSALIGRLSGQPLLIGTTGELPLAEIEAYGETAPVAIVPNFSAGVPLLLELIQQAVAKMPDEWRVEIIEAHHDQKKDAPSGTAKRMQRAVTDAGGEAAPPTHAIRAGDTIGEHTIWLAGPGERLELKHVATRREVFAIGALRWAAWLTQQPPGVYRPERSAERRLWTTSPCGEESRISCGFSVTFPSQLTVGWSIASPLAVGRLSWMRGSDCPSARARLTIASVAAWSAR